MLIACKKIKIDSPDGLLTFEIGKMFVVDNTLSFSPSHISWETTDKIVMVRDMDNVIRFYNYTCIEAEPLMPFPSNGFNVRSLIN